MRVSAVLADSTPADVDRGRYTKLLSRRQV